MLVGRGGILSFSAGPDGVFMVDDRSPLTPKIVAAVAKFRSNPFGSC